MAAYVLMVLAFVTLSIFYNIFNLICNIRVARGTGLPHTLSFIHELEICAYFTDPILRWLFLRRIQRGQGWPLWARFMIKDWHYEDRRRAHDQFGDVFLVVSPAGIVCYVGEATTAAQILTRRTAFIKPPGKMSEYAFGI